jgi:hypothetical protein
MGKTPVCGQSCPVSLLAVSIGDRFVAQDSRKPTPKSVKVRKDCQLIDSGY